MQTQEKDPKKKKQSRIVNGETYISGIEDRHLLHGAGPACPPLHDFVLVVIPLFQRGSRVGANKNGQWGAHTRPDNGWILNF